MNFIRKSSLAFIATLSLALANQCLCLNDMDDFDTFLNELENDEIFNTTQFTYVRKGFDPEQILHILLEMGVVELLQEDIFLRTNPLNKRNVLDLPIALLDKNYTHNDWIIGLNLFWNKIDRCYFSQSSDSISSYLGITQDSFLAKLDAAAKKIAALAGEFSFDPLDIILLFENGTVQQRQFGFLLYGEKQFRKWHFSCHLPFYYLERNLWLTQEEQDAIDEELGVTDEEQKEALKDEHAVSDKLGFGDTRLSFDIVPFETRGKLDFRLGGQITIPTAWAIFKGLEGNHFVACPRKQHRNFADLTGYTLAELINMAIEEIGQFDDAFKMLKKMSFESLDQIAANLLEAPLGNSGHLGVGVYSKTIWPITPFIKRNWARNIMYKGFLSLEYLFPATEKRFFVECIDPEAFDRDFDDADKAEENLIFLEEQFVDKFFPFFYDTTVHPGIVFRWTGKFMYETDRWSFCLGTDTWVRSKESLTNIQAPCNQIDKLNVGKARRLLGYQSKVIGSVFYKSQRRKRNWFLSLNGDYTWWSSGIGKDYTLSFNLEIDF